MENSVKCKRKRLLKEFASNVTLHGFRFLFEAKGIRRITWFFITTSCLAFSVVLFYSILADFLSYKTMTESTTVCGKSKTEFPTITICPINYVSRMKVKDMLRDTSIEVLIRVFETIKNPQMKLNFTDPKLKRIFQLLEERNVTTVKQLRLFYELELSEMVDNDIVDKISLGTYCKYEGKPCSKQNFTTVSSWTTSFCSQFNGYSKNGPLTVRSKGMSSGLHLTFNLHTNESIFSTYPFEGIVVHINSFGNPHQMAEYTQHIILPTGTFSLIELSTVKVNLLPSPYATKCGTKDFVLVKNFPYSKAMCYLDCVLDFVYKECGCLGYDVEEYVDVEVCSIKKISCYQTGKDRILKEKSKHCVSQCPQECTQTLYEIKHSEANLGTFNTLHDIQKLQSWKNHSKSEISEYIRKNVITVNVVFSDFSVVHKTVGASVSWITLLGTIGGNLGLCLGFSLITVFEFLFFIFDYIGINAKIQNNELMV